MKSKLLIMGVLCAVAFTANAQTEKGKNLIGGSFNFFIAHAGESGNTYKQKEFAIGPNFGHFFGKNLAIGLNVNYSHSKVSTSYEQLIATNGIYNTIVTTQTQKQNNTNIGPFIRYYLDITDKFKFFGQLSASVGFGKSELSNSIPSEFKNTTYGTNFSPSLAFFPTKKLAVELGFGLISYTNSTNKNVGSNISEPTTEVFRFGFDSINPTLGVNFHF